MEFKHTSVLLKECIEGLAIKEDAIYVDGTLGGAGHSSHIAARLSKCGTIIGIDRDVDALEASSRRFGEYGCKKILVHSNYADIKSVLVKNGVDKIDGALLDLGVSSFQLDNKERGFSYMQDSKLDMRMNRSDDKTAYDVVNTYSVSELERIIREYSEERWAKRIAKFIEDERKIKPIKTTFELVDLIKKAIPLSARKEGPHPAKRTFQAIRIEVNEEISKLERAIEDFCDVLADGGRFCVITFHSLEDRIVKNVFNRRANPCTCPPNIPMCVCGKVADIRKITKKPIVASAKELEENPRSRSAKLRIVEKIDG